MRSLEPEMSRVRTGLERLMEDPPAWLKGRRLGLQVGKVMVPGGVGGGGGV